MSRAKNEMSLTNDITDKDSQPPAAPGDASQAAPSWPATPFDQGIWRENHALLGRYRLGRLLHRLFYDDDYLIRLTAEERKQLADIQTDLTRAEADLDANTQTVAALKGTVGNVVTLVSGLNTEIATLKSAGADTTGLEAKLTAFEQNNQYLAAQNQALAALLPAAGTAGASGATP